MALELTISAAALPGNSIKTVLADHMAAAQQHWIILFGRHLLADRTYEHIVELEVSSQLNFTRQLIMSVS